jgi:hypothetical protein
MGTSPGSLLLGHITHSAPLTNFRVVRVALAQTEQLMAWLELKLFFGPDKRSSVQLFRKLSAEREGRCGPGRPSPSTSPTPSSPLQKTVSPSKVPLCCLCPHTHTPHAHGNSRQTRACIVDART